MTSTNSDLSEEQKETLSSSTERQETMKSATTKDIPAFGWSDYAERMNGRFAMVGFSAILLIEAFSRTSFLHWAGFR